MKLAEVEQILVEDPYRDPSEGDSRGYFTQDSCSDLMVFEDMRGTVGYDTSQVCTWSE